MTSKTIATTPTALPLTAGQWTLDPYHSAVGFPIRHLGISKVRGQFGRFEADLTIGEVTRSVTLDVEFGGVEDSVVDGRRHAGFEAKGEIRRSDFDLGFALAILGDSVKIQLDMQFVEPE
ncbi:YceI family protein [Nonomuraea helvata]|uniref:YceI family protein n=1 Tax=Nonomuraea helvata TaxID=37484 RepID=A0ABV5RXU2_9ACTN